MGRVDLKGVLEFLSLSLSCNSRQSKISPDDREPIEHKVLTTNKEIVQGRRDLAHHLHPKTVVLRVSMHCNGCARKVRKLISKMEGVASFDVDLERKKVVVVGELTPFQVLESISKIKFAELWKA